MVQHFNHGGVCPDLHGHAVMSDLQTFLLGPGGVCDPVSPSPDPPSPFLSPRESLRVSLLDTEEPSKCEELLTGLEQRPLQGLCVSLNVDNQVEEINVEMPLAVEVEL